MNKRIFFRAITSALAGFLFGFDARMFYALGFCGAAHHLLSAMVTAFPPGAVFAFFSGMMVLQLLWVGTMVRETKGVPLEQIQQEWEGA